MDKVAYLTFVEELQNHHNRGIGNDCTSHPVFYVKEKQIRWDCSDGYHDHVSLYCSSDDVAYHSVESWKIDQDKDSIEYLFLEEIEDVEDTLSHYDTLEDIFDAYTEHPEMVDNGWTLLYGKDEYRTVSVSMTRSGAETFILQNRHRHGALEVWVESQYHNKEYRDIVDILTSGKVVWNEK